MARAARRKEEDAKGTLSRGFTPSVRAVTFSAALAIRLPLDCPCEWGYLEGRSATGVTAPMRYCKTSVALTTAIIAVLAGCASEKDSHAQTFAQSASPTEKIYYTQTSAQTANADGLAVLVARSARIEGSELIWSCVYQTTAGRVLVEQREECERAK